MTEPAARVAWAYLGALLAAMVTGLLVVVVDQGLVPMLCPPPSESLADDTAAVCQLAWALTTVLVGFLVALGPVLRVLKQDGWLWLAFATGFVALFVVDAVTQWWWWLALLVLPAAAALVSARWSSRKRVVAIQRGVLATAAIVAAGLLAWWYLGG